MNKRDKTPGLSETDHTPGDRDNLRRGRVPGNTIKAKAVLGSGQVMSEKWVGKGFSEEGRVSRVSREKKEATLSRLESRDAGAEGTARAGVLPGERWWQSAGRRAQVRVGRSAARGTKPAHCCGTQRARAEHGGLIPRRPRATGRCFADGGLGWFLLQGHYSGWDGTG